MKNLTQLPWSGKGSKAKNDNTLGRMRGGIRSRIGSMSLKNTSLFGVILTLLLTFGVGEMNGGTYTVVGVAMTNENNYYPRISVNTGGGDGCGWWNWCFNDKKAGITFEGKKLYLAEWTDCHNGSDALYFQQYTSNCGSEKNYNLVHDSYTAVANYNTKIYEYNESGTRGSWYSTLTMGQSKVYFDATGWSESDIDLCIAHMNYQQYIDMTAVANTKLYYTNGSYSWNDAMGFGVVGGHNRTDGQSATGNYWITDVSKYSAEYTGFRHYGINDNASNAAYLVVNHGKAGEQPDVDYNANYKTLLNSTQTIQSWVSTNNGSSYSQANSKADITITSYAMTAQGSSGATASNGSLSTSASSTTVTAARTATTTLSVGAVADGFVFVGWYDSSNNLLSSETSYTYYPTAETTVRARFKNETSHTVTISNYCTTTSSEISSSNRGIGETTAVSVTAPEITGYTFVNWTLGTGISNQSGSTTANPISVKTLSTGTYTMQANYTAKTTVRLYYTNPGGFSMPKAYFWYSSTTSDNNGWPGTAMTSTTECGDTYYYVEYYKEDHPNWNRVIFNDNGNSSTQTSDITFSNTTNNGQYNNAPASKGGAGSWSASAPQKWALAGSMNSWSTSANMFTCDDGTLSLDITLSANTEYNFKVVDVPANKWYGTASATKITYENQATAQTISQVNGATTAYQTMRSAAAGTYTFTWDPSNKKVKVSYPTSYKVELEVGTVKGNDRTPTIYHTSATAGNEVTSGNYVAAGTKVIFWIANSAASAPKAGYNWWGFYNNAAGTGTTTPQKYTDNTVSIYTINSIAANMHVYAVFGEIDYYITPYINGQGSVSPNGANAHIATPTSFTATPGTGYMFSSWEERGGSAMAIATPSAATTNVTTTAAATLQANFVPQWSVVGTGAFGGWSAYGTNLFTGYTKVSTKDVGYKTITLAANTNYEIKVYDRANSTLYGGSANQTIDYAHSGAGNEYTIATTSSPKSVFIQSAAGGTYTLNWNLTDKKIAVVYPTSWYITTGVNDALGGSFTAVDNSSNNVYGGKFVANSANVVFTATPNTGYNFSGWYSNSTCTTPYTAGTGVAFSGEGNSVMTLSGITADKTVYAKFTAKTYNVALDMQTSAEGYGSGSNRNETVTFNATLTTVGSLPTAANGYAFMGFYSGTGGKGTQFINASGTWATSVTDTISDSKWVLDAGATLYAYYKKAEITELTLAETIVGTAETDSITVTPVIAPLPAGTTIVCWEVQYSNGTALPSQPAGRLVSGNTYRFKAPSASATYRIQATLRSGSSCGGGSVLSTRVATFQVAGDHTVTVQYKCGDMTIAESVELDEIKPLIWSDGITAPSITGYTFSGWVAGDGVTIKEGESSTATTHIKATYDGTLTANYTRKRMIYFYNTLNWENVYVYFYKDANYWDASNGTGTDPSYYSGSHAAAHKGQMLPITEGSKIYYFDAEAISIPSGYTNVAFTEKQQDNCWYFYDNNKVIRRGDYKSATMPMFVPLAGQTPVNKNGNTAKYYNEGYWMNYPENTGYTLKIYDSQGASTPTRTIRFPYSEDLKMPLKLDVDLNDASRDYYYTIYREDGTVLSANYNMNINYHTDVRLNDSSKKIKITTTASGIYTFTLVYKDNGGTKDYYISVDYPIGTNDYRVWYSDNAAWSGAAHTGSWYHASDIINKNADAEVTQYDTVSLYIAKGDGITTSMKFQYASNIEESGSVTWTDVVSGGITLSSYSSVITKAGVYNFIIKQVGTATPVVEKVEPYTGNYYIRTDCAGDTKWDSYKTADHHMTYSDYAENNSGYSHYYAHWVTNGSNVKFCIANDFSASITDTLVQDYGTTIANINAGGYLASGEAHNANIRFMWNQSTNKLSRAYIAGSGNITDRFLVLEGDAKMYDENGNALTGEHQDHDQYGTKLGTDNQVIMHDDENFVYERTIQVNTKACAKLTAKYNNNVQYFIGGAEETVELLGGETSPTKYTMRIVYDFKTNRLVTAYMPSDAAITENLAINADIMLVREHQNAGQQLTFEGKGSLSKVKTVYGVMRFNRWTLNNKSTAAGHAPVGDPKSTYERSLYWISFPFDVNLSDVFGFGTYGTHWIIEYYDGAERATEGYWKDSEGFWKYITNRRGVKLEAGKGYILALDLDLMRDNNETFWAHEIQQVELFFPSAAAVENIEKTDTEIDIPAHECTIAPRPGQTDDRRKKDSHWNIIGVPSYANYGTELKNGNNETITWNDDPETKDLPFLYEWNTVDNSYSVQSGTTYPFKSMHAYMVQYFGKIKWSLASATPSPVVARHADAPQDVEFRLELQAGEKVADQTFVKMTTDEQISTAFDFNYDLSKQMNSGKANIYTMVEGYIQTAGNCLPMTEQTTVVPVGVKIAADGDYTFAIPDGTEGVGVTLIDQETGIRTSLSALAYTVSLEAGTYDERFVLEISPIHNVPTEQSAVRDQQTDVRKVLIDGLLYIVRDNKMYDARGAMVMEK